jgi:D-tyrosyl-tRNA(Tyr) deacylase
MRVLIQRVARASVMIEGHDTQMIQTGLVLLVGVEAEDGAEDVQWLTHKITQMRLFNDHEGKMNRSLLEVGGDLLVVSQFTLHASTRKGNRPSFIKAAHPDLAKPLYQQLVVSLEKATGKAIFTGVFGADMKVELINDGPVTIWIDSRQRE